MICIWFRDVVIPGEPNEPIRFQRDRGSREPTLVFDGSWVRVSDEWGHIHSYPSDRVASVEETPKPRGF